MHPAAHHEHSPFRATAILWLVAGTAAWGLSFPLIKALMLVQEQLLPGVNSWFLSSSILAVRSLCAAVILALIVHRRLRQLHGKELEQGLLLGLFGGLGMVLQADGLKYTHASTSAFLTQFYCVLLPVWHAASRRMAPGLRVLACTALVIAGMCILSGFDVRTFHLGRGEWETIASALMFTVQIILLELPRYRENRTWPMTVIMFGGFAAAALPVMFFSAPSTDAILQIWSDPRAMGLILAVALLCTVFSYGMMNRWQPHVSATEAGLIYCMEPVFTALYVLFLPAMVAAMCGVAYANESLTTPLVVGGSLVTLANIILVLPQRKASPTSVNPPGGS